MKTKHLEFRRLVAVSLAIDFKSVALVSVLAGCMTMAAYQLPMEATAAELRQSGAPPVDRNLCLDESGRRSSVGSLRKVNNQIQRCEEKNRWVIGSQSGHASGAVSNVPKKDCTGNHADRYESGLFRSVGTTFELCADGKWTPVRPK